MFPNAKNIAFTHSKRSERIKRENKKRKKVMPLNRLVCGVPTCADGAECWQNCQYVNKNICVYLHIAYLMAICWLFPVPLLLLLFYSKVLSGFIREPILWISSSEYIVCTEHYKAEDNGHCLLHEVAAKQ